ncbi:MAG TPA: flagellar biosynthetic protein FliO [Spongiibacteraceae bacterium]|nr:flagellar biosynthetic protein FliO [Spongiibacteraceae bacterium]HCS27715.1 flagellar biosynthetic protein FliO [Spongiibacteraceae bacterium]|tara:strand:+ start:1526 stop:2014 length:489 start_codon:yes stop_codon:yes gene_type:complete
MTRLPLSFLLLSVACPSGLVAAADLTGEADVAPGLPADVAQRTMEPLSYGNALSVIGSLMLVLAVLFAAAWLMRRGQGFIRPKAGQIQVVSQIALGVKEKVLLLKVGEENILVGCTAGNIRSLHTWQGELPDAPVEDSKAGDTFMTLLQQQLRPGSNKGDKS